MPKETTSTKPKPQNSGGTKTESAGSPRIPTTKK